MKFRFFISMLLLSLTCSCAPLLAEHTSVELYNTNGSLLGKVYSNKGYDGFKCLVTVDSDNRIKELEWSAKQINSDTIAAEAVETNKLLSGAIVEFVKTGAKTGAALATGVPIK